jgi:hypothetical protein
MNNIYSTLRELARSIRAQNLFVASKEIFGIKLFHNSYDFSKLQEIYLSYLYSSNSISNDIIMEKISEHVFDSEIYEDAYLLWKRKNMKKINIKDNKQNDVNLVVGKKIKFPTKEK